MTERPKKPEDDKPLRSYFYPDKTPNLQEVNIGYRTYNHNLLLVPLVLIPLFAIFVGMTVSTHRYFHITCFFLIISSEMYQFYENVQRQMDSSEFWQTITAVLIGSFAFFLAITVYLLR
jgi:FlaA1/EpsC-like NDP-sugar epimerase